MTKERIVSHEQECMRLRDEISRERRELPWELVRKQYVFETANGRETLAELFGKRTQLIVYHIMFDPESEIGCRSCSFWADNFNGIVPHLAERDVALVAVSRAPLQKLRAQAKRCDWTFRWASSLGSDFNVDYNGSFYPETLERRQAFYDYRTHELDGTEWPGFSAFFRDGAQIFHTHSTHARGIEMLSAAYQCLDIAPRGRDEDALPGRWPA